MNTSIFKQLPLRFLALLTMTALVFSAFPFYVFQAHATVDAEAVDSSTDTVEVIFEKKFSGPIPDDLTADQFSFSVEGYGEVELIAENDGFAKATIELPVGSYELTENLPDSQDIIDWRIQWSGQCDESDDDNNLAFLVIEAEDFEDAPLNCRADNQYRPVDHDDDTEEGEEAAIVIEKVVTDDSDTEQEFTFSPSWDDDFELSDGESAEFEVATGTYSISETVPADWEQTDVTCVSSNGDDETADNIVLSEDETVTCTFTNEELSSDGEVYTCEADGLLFLDTDVETGDAGTASLFTVDEGTGAATFWAEYELDLYPVLAVADDSTVYTIDIETGELLTLDDDGGAYSVIGDTGLTAREKPVAMEFAPNGTLYVFGENNNALYEINTTTGDATKVHDLDLDVSGGDMVFEGDTIVYLRNQGQVYGIDSTTYDETLLGTLAVGSERITSAASKDGTHYAYSRQNGFYPFTLDPFVAGTKIDNTGPFAWGDGSYCPFKEIELDTKVSGQKWNDLDGDGVWDEGEPTIAGVTICAENLETDEVHCTETNELGYYIFHDVEEGEDCRIYEEIEEPWVQTYPESGECLIEDPEAGVEYYCDFGNHEPERLACEPDVNLIANGGFETPEVTDAAGWDIFDLSTYPAVAWAVEFVSAFAGAPDEASLELHAGVNGWLPSSGEQYAELDADWQGPSGTAGEEASVAISQTIDTIPGQEYTLTWDFSPRPDTAGAENALLVTVAGDEVANNGGSTDDQTNWTSHSYTFTADDTETTVSFADDGEPNSRGTFVDNVGLYCKPVEAPMCELEVLSNTDTVVIENNEYAVETYEDGVWTADIDNADWVWESDYVIDPEATTTLTFKETFEVENGMNALLEVAADNSYQAFLNGDLVIDQSAEKNNYGSLNQDDVDVSSSLVDGTNTLTIVVTNHAVENANAMQNPAGVLYRLTLTGDEGSCEITTDRESDDQYYLEGYVWEDEDRNGQIAQEEGFLSDWVVSASNGDITVSTTTDANGYYRLKVPAGTWQIYQTLEEDWELVFPGSESHVVTVPEEVASNFFEQVFAFIIPTAHAQTIDMYGPFNFGLANSSDGGGGGGGGGSSAPRCNLFEFERDGNDITLNWETYRANELFITGNGDEIFDTDDDDDVDEGEFSTDITEDTTFELTVVRGTRERTCDVEVEFLGGLGGDFPDGRTLGEQVSIVPTGAPDAGAGGAANGNSPLAFVLVVLSMLALLTGMRFTKVNEDITY